MGEKVTGGGEKMADGYLILIVIVMNLTPPFGTPAYSSGQASA